MLSGVEPLNRPGGFSYAPSGLPYIIARNARLKPGLLSLGPSAAKGWPGKTLELQHPTKVEGSET